MLFNSISYAIFLPIVFIVFWALSNKYRQYLLLIASYYFYMCWNPKYVVLILFTTIISYICGLLLEKETKKYKKRLIVFISLILSLGVLFVFKYYNFMLENIAYIFDFKPKLLDLILPVGISFYTFQTISYVIDVYRKNISAEKNFCTYAAFISFFPQLVAGPIERTNKLLPQLKGEFSFSVDNAHNGIRLIVWGLYKKMLIADNLSLYVDRVYLDLYNWSDGSILIATLFFSVQIYCDFSGYSDIARGTAKLFGIELMENFKSPYFSTTVKEFWSKWHISLSSFFKDYVYIPMGGNRVGKLRNYMNIMVTFIVSGLWHGARWNYIIWGFIHGLAQVSENIIGIKKRDKKDLYYFVRIIMVFIFVLITWVFFRANTVYEGYYAVINIVKCILNPITSISIGFKELGISIHTLPELLMYFLPLTIVDYFSLNRDVIQWMGEKKQWIRHIVLIAFIALILMYGYVGKSTFVYFQF